MQIQRHKILLGVTGGIAAYKSADLVRRLREREFDVRVVMTSGACEFVTPLTFQALSGNLVHRDLFDEQAESAMGHIQLARWADYVLVAPATADFMAKLAGGRADDLLTTLCLATTAPLILAPSMNKQMWRNVATSNNLRLLLSRGVRVIGPVEGDQACGDKGEGRMTEPADIAEVMHRWVGRGCLSGLSVLVTAGPTQEALDPVRYLSNHSSGKMGYAVAAAAADAGATVKLVSGPTSLATPFGVERFSAVSALDMHRCVMENILGSNIFIGAAAVADYSPAEPAEKKIKKSSDGISISLHKTRDILADVASLKSRPFTVGFAAETENVETYARSKLSSKGIDLIAANDVSKSDRGFESNDNELYLYWKGGSKVLGLGPKIQVARKFIDVIADLYHEKYPA
ncbi:MAG: bifunctional phosphopantothenoylcysteine decarboxylase/phosphopantothenate--cysteine ligase CoaBC [Rhodospirillaceae bacterium]|nr:bifunctional phosphopantothenoylcysteine decarboxylase/phosphopantothenate--cysteine ligase CoaBC [Rhodospirillaceae bacterium]